MLSTVNLPKSVLGSVSNNCYKNLGANRKSKHQIFQALTFVLSLGCQCDAGMHIRSESEKALPCDLDLAVPCSFRRPSPT